MIDIVVDTNVLAHTRSYREPRFEDSIQFLSRIMASRTVLCLDKEFGPDDESPDRSLMGYEYRQHLRGQSMGSQFISFMVQRKRYVAVGTKLPRASHEWIKQNFRRERDRTFVRVACNSQEKVFVTHDFNDFPASARRQMKKKLSLIVCDAATCKLAE